MTALNTKIMVNFMIQLRAVTWWTKVSPQEKDHVVDDIQFEVQQFGETKPGNSKNKQSFSRKLICS